MRYINILIAENAHFSYKGGNLGYSYGASYYGALSITVDKNAVMTLSLSGTRSRLRTALLTVNEGASLYLWASATNAANYRRAVECGSIVLNSPFQVVFAAAGTANGQLINTQTGTSFTANNVKSIRYFANGAGRFDTSMNYVGINRNDYTYWWFQETGLFTATATNWGGNPPSSVGSIGYAPVAGATPTIAGNNFGVAAVHAIQIDGGSRAPTIDPIYVGARSVSGTGVPGASITVTWPTTSDGITISPATTEPTTITTVESDGTWTVSVPDDVFLFVSGVAKTDEVKATQRETLYGLDRGESHEVYREIVGTRMKIVGHNSRSIYYNRGEIPDYAEVLLYGDGDHVTLLPGDGRYIITNAAISNIEDAVAFDALWATTPSGLRGYIGSVDDKFSSLEFLCDIPANCKVWGMADVTIGGVPYTVFDLITYNNLYERIQISDRMIEPPTVYNPTENMISDYSVIPGNYGVPYDLDDNVLRECY
jgi:hypothetical protein